MADVTLQPRPAKPGAAPLAVADGDLLLPLAGDWTAHLEFADQVEPPTGKVTLTWLGQPLQGFVLRSGQHAGRTFALIGGGEGGLGKALPAREHKNSPVREVLRQRDGRQGILVEAGEQLAAAADPVVLGRILSTWPRRADTASALLDDLCREVSAVWRMQPDGAVWVGQDAFPAAVLAEPLQVLDDADPAHATQLYVPHSFGPLPGQSLDGRRVGCAHYTISPDAAHLRLWFLDESTNDLEGGNLRRGLADLVREIMRLDFYASYPARVVAQRLDGTLDLQLDSRALPPLTQVRYRTLSPGARIVFDADARVEVRFDNADPTKPVAGLADPGNAQLGVARLHDPVNVGTLVFTAVASGVLVGAYTPPGGIPQPFSLGAQISLQGVISQASQKVFVP